METFDVLTKAYDHINVRTAIGEPIRYDGMTVIPVARVSGGGGGGGGTGPAESDEAQKGTGVAPAGEGAGFGMRSVPMGVFVVKDGKVTWRPAIDVNKVILGGQIVAIVALLTFRSVVKMLKKHREAAG